MLRPSLAAPVAALALAASLVAPLAHANGRFPASGQVVVDPNDRDHVVVEATYGVLVSHDRGKSWSWDCEKAVGYTGQEDPYLAISSTGELLAGSFEGLSTTKDECTWSFAGGPLKDRFVIDLALAPKGDSGVLVVSNSVSDGVYSTQLFETLDGGGTWKQAGVDLPSSFLGLTVEFARSDPKRVYVSGRYGKPTYPGSIERSDDRGQTWQRLDFPDLMGNLPYISAIDPANPDLFYVRIDGDPDDELLATSDGGKTWKSAFKNKGNLLGFALSPDGSTILLGGDKAGLWKADTKTMTFTQVSDLGVKCLYWNADGVYACADEGKDGFTVGLSSDEGKTFTPFMHRNNLCLSTCAQGTTVGDQCPIDWPTVQALTGSQGCPGSTTSSSTSATSSSSGGATKTSTGCSCALPRGDADTLSWSLGLGAAAALVVRRRARRGEPKLTR